MAPKRPTPLEKVPSPELSNEDDSEEIAEADYGEDSRSEEEEEEEEQDEEGEGDGEEEEKEGVGKKAKASRVKSNTETDDSISEPDSDPNSIQSHPSPTASDFTIKPISTDSKKSVKHPLHSRIPKPSKSSEITKLPLESEGSGPESRNRKKKKLSDGGDTPDKKMVWVEGDEVALLNALIEYQSRQRSHSNGDMIPFHEFAKKYLSCDLSKGQVINKVARLKKKFHTNANMGENGRVFFKPHEQKVFELGKKIWGVVEEAGADKKVNKNSNVCDSGMEKKQGCVQSERKNGAEEKDGIVDSGDVGEVGSSSPWLESSMVLLLNSLPESCAVLGKEGVSLLGKRKAKEFDEKWRKVQEAEIEIYLQKVKLIKEQSKVIWDTVRIANS